MLRTLHKIEKRRMLTLAGVIFFLLFFNFTKVYSQQPYTINLYMFNPMLVNPAYTGSHDVFTVSANGQKQWLGLTGSPFASSISAGSPLKRSNAAMGAFIKTEKFGVTSRTGFFYSYAYRIKIRNGKGGILNKGRGQGAGTLSFGLSGGFDLRNSNWTEVITSDEGIVDPEFAANSGTLFEPNFGFGLYFYNERVYAGFSVPRMLRYSDNPLEQSTKLSVRASEMPYYLNGGVVFDISRNVKMRPSVLFKWIPNQAFQGEFNANFIFGSGNKNYTIGLTYRTINSMIVLFQIDISRQLRIGGAYEYGFGFLSGFNSGSFEFLIQYEFGFNVRTTNPRYF